MISEESCETEDWSKYVQNSALHHRNTYLDYRFIIISSKCLFSQCICFYNGTACTVYYTKHKDILNIFFCNIHVIDMNPYRDGHVDILCAGFKK